MFKEIRDLPFLAKDEKSRMLQKRIDEREAAVVTRLPDAVEKLRKNATMANGEIENQIKTYELLKTRGLKDQVSELVHNISKIAAEWDEERTREMQQLREPIQKILREANIIEGDYPVDVKGLKSLDRIMSEINVIMSGNCDVDYLGAIRRIRENIKLLKFWDQYAELNPRSVNPIGIIAPEIKSTAYPCGVAFREWSKEDRYLATSFSLEMAGKLVAVELRGVFDGHGGIECAEFICRNLETSLVNWFRIFCSANDSELEILQALTKALPDLSRSFTENTSGSTANFSLYFPEKKRLIVVNVGDSRAILVRASGETEQLSRDHTLADPISEKEVYRRNGRLVNGRLALCTSMKSVQKFDFLEVPRALGDSNMPGVSARPGVVILDNVKEGDVLLHCTDGMTKAARTDQIAASMRNLMAQEDWTPTTVAIGLVALAKAAGVPDDITALVSQFKPILS